MTPTPPPKGIESHEDSIDQKNATAADLKKEVGEKPTKRKSSRGGAPSERVKKLIKEHTTDSSVKQEQRKT